MQLASQLKEQILDHVTNGISHWCLLMDNVNMQRGGDLTFLAAVKKQSKVKEGDWSEVKQQHDTNDNEDGMVDID